MSDIIRVSNKVEAMDQIMATINSGRYNNSTDVEEQTRAEDTNKKKPGRPKGAKDKKKRKSRKK